MSTPGRIMPPQRGTGPLDLVIAVMAFLAALALGASLIANRTADTWRAGLSGRMTVQILPPDAGELRPVLERETAAVMDVLRATDAIAFARPLSEAEEVKLISPWTGTTDTLEEFPLPQLIDVDIRPGAPLDIPALRAKLKAVAPHAVLDDHRVWIERLRDLSGSIVWSAYGILLLIAVATSAAVSFATRARLEALHDMVGLLHQMGARPGFIARTFEWYYAVSAGLAGLIGAGFAGGLFFAVGGLEQAGVAAVAFLPPLALVPGEFLWLLVVPAATALIGLATARASVLRFLGRMF